MTGALRGNKGPSLTNARQRMSTSIYGERASWRLFLKWIEIDGRVRAPFLKSTSDDPSPSFSPDGRWRRISRTNRGPMKSTSARFLRRRPGPHPVIRRAIQTRDPTPSRWPANMHKARSVHHVGR